jgi:hypothetical protein
MPSASSAVRTSSSAPAAVAARSSSASPAARSPWTTPATISGAPVKRAASAPKRTGARSSVFGS